MGFFVLAFYIGFYYFNVTHWSCFQVFSLKLKTGKHLYFFLLKINEELDLSL